MEQEALGSLGMWDEAVCSSLLEPELPEVGMGLDPQHIWPAACDIISQRP